MNVLNQKIKNMDKTELEKYEVLDTEWKKKV